MIKYKCPSCLNNLKTDDSMSGKQAMCPICKKVNFVLSKKDIKLNTKHVIKKMEYQIKSKKNLEQKIESLAPSIQNSESNRGDSLSKTESPSKTESMLQIIGILCVIFGIFAAVCCLHSPGSNIMLSIGVAFGGFLLGMPYLISHLVLRYLRRIMNAVEL
jgi:hypothetical protein